jgi:predicted transcriptional regulator
MRVFSSASLGKVSFESYLSNMPGTAPTTTETIAGERQRSIRLTDPRALRAVAHPIRLELLGLLRRTGPLTATQAANEIGESPASCSFHLRQLAKYGLVEEAGGGRGRERPWQATATFTEWAVEHPDDDERSEATAMLSRVVIERYLENALTWLVDRRNEPRPWAEASEVSDHLLYLTPEELHELNEQVLELFEPYYERLGNPETRPQGSRAVNYIRLVFPVPDGPSAE